MSMAEQATRAGTLTNNSAQTAGNNTPPGPQPNNRKGKVRAILVAVLVGVAIVAAFYYWHYLRPYEATDDAFINGDIVPIAPQVAGRIVRVLVNDNQRVKQGDALIEIDPSEYEVKTAEARANVVAAQTRREQAKAQLAVDQAKADQERSNVTAAEADAKRAEADLKRYQSVETRSVSRSQIDLAEAQARSSSAALAVARDKAKAAEAQVGLSKALIETAVAGVQQAEAAMRQAELNLSYTQVVAPDDGFVAHRTVVPGAYVQTGQALLALVPVPIYVVANFKETQLAHMRPGQPASIEVDAFPGTKFNGHVDSIQRGSGARFSLLPPENASGNYIKIVQRVPVKIVFEEPPDPSLPLGPGMSVVPTVKVR